MSNMSDLSSFNAEAEFREVGFGFDDGCWERGERKLIAWNEKFATNGHMLVSGKSGTGKSFTLRSIVTQMIKPLRGRRPVRVYNFDVHGDMKYGDIESRIRFSEVSHYGINPFLLSPDPDFGGVRKCVQDFIEMMSDSSPRAQLGPRQVSALRNILYEMFERRGFMVNDPSTWDYDRAPEEGPDNNGRIYLEVPYDEREMAKTAARDAGVTLQFDKDERSWWCSAYEGGLGRWLTRSQGKRPPTLPDAARFISQRLKAMVIGSDTKTIIMLEEHNKKVSAWQAKLRKLGEGGHSADMEVLQKDIENGAAVLIETFTNYVSSVHSGHELDQIARYESSETLKALADRLDTLVATGIFKPRSAPFDPAKSVWSFDIAPLRDSEQQFFVWTMLKQIFDGAIRAGPVSGASEINIVIILDEAHKFFKDQDNNILDKISKEARKFGIALICASQAPSHFSEDFLGNVSTKILLGLDSQYRDITAKKMRIDPRILDYVVPEKIAAVQVSDKRDSLHGFIKTRVGK